MLCVITFYGFLFFFFFFQAEDGIRDLYVTGVQTCALPISASAHRTTVPALPGSRTSAQSASRVGRCASTSARDTDRKSTRLNSSHVEISYAVFCLKKKKKKIDNETTVYEPYTGSK